jgi:hypothetical protein
MERVETEVKYGGRDISKALHDWQLSRPGAEKAFSGVCPNSEKEREEGKKGQSKGAWR